MRERNEHPAADGEELERLNVLGAQYHLDVLAALPPNALDAGLVGDLSVDWARQHCLLPVLLNGETCVLTADPDCVAEQAYLSLLLGRDLTPVLAPRRLILSSIEQCYYSRDASPGEFLRELEESPAPVGEPAASAGADLLRVASGTPVTQLVNLILLEAVKQRASDIHVEPLEDRLRVRYRIDGILYEQTSSPKHMEPAVVSRVKVMAHLDVAERRLPQDGAARVRVGEREIDVRVSTIPVEQGERVVLRLLDSGAAMLPLAALGMSSEVFAGVTAMLSRNHGIALVCGPTGSGKTTTLYAALGELDADRRNILTIEDPVEYQLPGIGQIQVKPKIGLTFASGLRHILRQDPDVILVGEMRDRETADIALRAALTGHLVFSTLHTNHATGAVLRLIDMGVAPHLLASCLRGVLAQRLVRALCVACRRETTITRETVGLPADLLARHIGRTVWEPVGCGACREGFRGRTGVFEWMPITDELSAAVRDRTPDEKALRRLAIAEGMVRMADDALSKVLAGRTTLSEWLATD